MEGQLPPCPEGTDPNGTPKRPDASAFAEGDPPLPQSRLPLSAGSRRGKELEEGERVERAGTSPCEPPLSPRNTARTLRPAGGTVASCLIEVLPTLITPTAVKKFRNTTDPGPGAKTIFYGTADDPDIATHLTHGIKTYSSFNVGSLINPIPKTNFQEKLQDMKEAIYSSNREAPLGRTHDHSSMLPEGLDIINTTFGIKILKDVSAGEIVNPPKTFEEVDKEAREGHDLYIVSHEDYDVGETVNRKYNSHFNKSFVYGMETPHYEDGRRVAKTFNWVFDLDSKRAANIVLKRSDDYKEKFQPQVGKALDPIAETRNVPRDHTFGLLLPPDVDGVCDLLRVRVPCEFLCGKDREKAVLSAVRQSLKKVNYQNFDVLLNAFRHYDKNGDGMIDKDNLRKSCFQLNLDLDDELLDSLFDCCDTDKDGLINYLEFANFLNWKDKMAVKEFEEKIITKGKKLDACLVPKDTQRNDETLLKQEDVTLKEPESSEKIPKPPTKSTDHVFASYQTTSSQYNAVVGGLPTSCYPLCGVPTIRSDIPAPRTRRINDTTNYGDQGNSYAVLFPSVFSEKGVYEEQLLKKRPKAEIAQILHNIGMNGSDERFEEIWKKVCTKHQIKELCDCEESMWVILHKIYESHTKTHC